MQKRSIQALSILLAVLLVTIIVTGITSGDLNKNVNFISKPSLLLKNNNLTLHKISSSIDSSITGPISGIIIDPIPNITIKKGNLLKVGNISLYKLVGIYQPFSSGSNQGGSLYGKPLSGQLDSSSNNQENEGTLSVTSTPSGAEIFVDGTDMDGKTPSDITGPPGTYTISLSLNGYKTVEKTGTITSGEITSLHFTLESVGGEKSGTEKSGGSSDETGTLTITSTPDGASIFADGSDMEATTPSEFDADPGSYVIRVSLDGYKTAEKQVTITSGEIATANFYLELAGEGQEGIDENTGESGGIGTLSVKSTPDGASIFADGSNLDATTPSEFDADPGSYVISVSLEGYKTAEKQVTVTSGEIATANFYLEPAGEGQEGIDENTGESGGIGTLSVKSTPDGASIFADGSDMEATTPSEFDADPGSYVISVSLEGYKTAEKQVTVTSGEIATANFYLEPAEEGQEGIDENTGESGGIGTLSVKSTPSGASIFADGSNLDAKTPSEFDADPGSYMISVSLDGYKTAEKQAAVTAGEVTSVSFNLEPTGESSTESGTGSISFSSTPYGATVFLDGEEIPNKVTPFTKSNIPRGIHKAFGELDGIKTGSIQIQVEEGFTSEVSFLFKPGGTSQFGYSGYSNYGSGTYHSGDNSPFGYSESEDYSAGSFSSGSSGFGSGSYLTLQSLPSGADVFINNQHIGKTPVSQEELSPGTYSIRFEKEGYQDTEFTVTVSGSSMKTVTRSMSPL
ncbi:MAG: PEGA domain-containing protein [Methanomicrobiales archaeon]|nr:PEGA domain-containing protein [Methanomicrobiales archaeon]